MKGIKNFSVPKFKKKRDANLPPLAAIYCRVSSKKQAKEGKGLESQERYCKDIIQKEGWEYYKTYSNPKGVSGEVKPKHRPEFMKMLEDAENGEFSIVVIYSMDRIGRKILVMEKGMNMIFDIKGLKLWAGTMLIENTLMGRLYAGIMGNMVQYDKGMLLDRMKNGLTITLDEKGDRPGKPPYGYIRKGKRDTLRVEIVLHEADTIRRIYKEYREGKTYTEIARGLNNDKIPTARQGEWDSNKVKRILVPERQLIYEGGVKNGQNKKGLCWPQILEIDPNHRVYPPGVLEQMERDYLASLPLNIPQMPVLEKKNDAES